MGIGAVTLRTQRGRNSAEVSERVLEASHYQQQFGSPVRV